MHLGSALLIVWLIIGGFAAGQRGDYHGTLGNCTKASTAAVTILAGPLNYVGVTAHQLHHAAAQHLAIAAPGIRLTFPGCPFGASPRRQIRNSGNNAGSMCQALGIEPSRFRRAGGAKCPRKPGAQPGEASDDAGPLEQAPEIDQPG
jgi:hypothetical protein